MFSSTLKRSVATLGVGAGLLAAGGPASADGTTCTTTGIAPPPEKPPVSGPAPAAGAKANAATAASFSNGVLTVRASVPTDYDRNGFSPQAPTSEGITVDAGSDGDT